MATKRIFLLALLIELLCLGSAKAQYVSEWSLNAIRVGIDPIKTWSMLLNANNYKDRPVFFNFAEGYLELLLHLRTSAVFEGGYSKSHWNQRSNTFFYQSEGYFWRGGLDFNITEPDPDFEVDLGWRLGMSSFKQNSRVVLKGDYWGNNLDQTPMKDFKAFTYWGEILLDAKTRVFRNSERQFFSNLWFQASLRIRFKQTEQAIETDQYYMIPGYGFNNRIMPGLHFALTYFIKLKEKKVYRIHHVYDSKVLIKKGR
jgi:hypothetical protein